MTSYLTDAANAVARDPNKPTIAEVEAYLDDIERSLKGVSCVTVCELEGYHRSMHDVLVQGRNYLWRSSVAAGEHTRYDVLSVATSFDSVGKKGNLIVLEVSLPTSPVSSSGVEIRTNFCRCDFLNGKKIESLPLRNDEASYKPVRGTWSERDMVLQEFARLLIGFGSPAISKALRPIETPVNAFEDALRAQPK